MTIARKRNVPGYIDEMGRFRPIRSAKFVGSGAGKRKATIRDRKKYSRPKAGDLGKARQERALEAPWDREHRLNREAAAADAKERARIEKEIEAEVYGETSGRMSSGKAQSLAQFVRGQGGINTAARSRRGKKVYGDLENFTRKGSGTSGLVTTVKGKGKGLDSMWQLARQSGFDLVSSDDLLDRLDDEIRSGKMTYATHGSLSYNPVEMVLWGHRKGEPDWAEEVITTKAEHHAAAKKWAKENGFDRFRVARLDLSTPPDFKGTVRKNPAGKKNPFTKDLGGAVNVWLHGYSVIEAERAGHKLCDLTAAARKLIADGHEFQKRQVFDLKSLGFSNYRFKGQPAGKKNPVKVLLHKFYVGQKLAARSIGDNDVIYRGQVISRTPKFVTLKIEGDRELKRCGVSRWEDTEVIYPFGRYSMAPSFRAKEGNRRDNPAGKKTANRFDDRTRSDFELMTYTNSFGKTKVDVYGPYGTFKSFDSKAAAEKWIKERIQKQNPATVTAAERAGLVKFFKTLGMDGMAADVKAGGDVVKALKQSVGHWKSQPKLQAKMRQLIAMLEAKRNPAAKKNPVDLIGTFANLAVGISSAMHIDEAMKRRTRKPAARKRGTTRAKTTARRSNPSRMSTVKAKGGDLYVLTIQRGDDEVGIFLHDGNANGFSKEVKTLAAARAYAKRTGRKLVENPAAKIKWVRETSKDGETLYSGLINGNYPPALTVDKAADGRWFGMHVRSGSFTDYHKTAAQAKAAIERMFKKRKTNPAGAAIGKKAAARSKANPRKAFKIGDWVTTGHKTFRVGKIVSHYGDWKYGEADRGSLKSIQQYSEYELKKVAKPNPAAKKNPERCLRCRKMTSEGTHWANGGFCDKCNKHAAPKWKVSQKQSARGLAIWTAHDYSGETIGQVTKQRDGTYRTYNRVDGGGSASTLAEAKRIALLGVKTNPRPSAKTPRAARKNPAAKYKIGDKVYSYWNPDTAGSIGQMEYDQHGKFWRYAVNHPRLGRRWINEKTLRKSPHRKTKARKNPPARVPVRRTFEMFQGRPATTAKRLPVSRHAPARLDQLGDLIEVKLNSGKVLDFSKRNFKLCAAGGKLWIAGGKIAKLNPAAAANEINPIDSIDHVVYGTSKPHHGDHNYTHYIHKLGEESGHMPTLCADREGFPIIRGGKYKIEARGIVN